MVKKNAYFVHVWYDCGKRFVLDEDAFRSITIERTPSSDVVTVTYEQPIGAVLSFQVDLSQHEHLEIRGI